MRNADSDIDGIKSKIADTKASIADLINQNNGLAAKLDKASKDLTYLKGQLPIYEADLNKLYNQGNDAITNTKNAKSNLDAALKRFQD